MSAEWARLLIEVILLAGGFGSVIITLRTEMRHVWLAIDRIEKSTTRAHQRVDEMQLNGG